MDEFKRGYLYARAMHTSTFRKLLLLQLPQEAEVYMARFLHHDFFFTRRRFLMILLASLWTMGLLFGMWVFAASGASLVSLMRSTLRGSVSIVSLFFVTGLPFLFSAFAVFISCHWLILPIAFCKGVCLSFVSTGILTTFASGGWLIWFLLCFCDVVTMPLLYWFWMSCFRAGDRLWRHRCLLTAALLILAGSMDYSLIRPFLADLIIL